MARVEGRKVHVSRTVDLVATLAAGAVGATVAVLTIGANLVLVLPAVVGVGAVALLTRRP